MTCPREIECIRAAKTGDRIGSKTGNVPSDMAAHIEQCAACAEAMRIADALNSMTTQAQIEPADARILWLLAAERRHNLAEQKFERLTRWIPLAAAVMVIIATGVYTLLSGSSPVDGLLGASGRVGFVFLIALAFVILVVWTAPGRRART